MSLRQLTARFPGECARCGAQIEPGQQVWYLKGLGTWHVQCPEAQPPPGGWTHCRRCGQELTHPESVARGYGPVCYGMAYVVFEPGLSLAEKLRRIEELAAEAKRTGESFDRRRLEELARILHEQAFARGDAALQAQSLAAAAEQARAQRPKASPAELARGKLLVAKYPGWCRICGEEFPAGARIYYAEGKSAHAACVDPERERRTQETLAASRAASAEDAGSQAVEVRERLARVLPPGLRLYPFQEAGVAWLERTGGRALIADEMGLGKTVQALAWLALHPEARPAVIVVPASVKLNWAREAARWLPRRPENQVVVLNGGRSGTLPPGSIYVINYDILTKWRPALLRAGLRVVVLDECHYIKNSQAQRTKAIVGAGRGQERQPGLAEGVPHVIALSGTPLVNRPAELWTTVHLLRPDVFKNFMQYAKRYCGARHNGWGWDFSGASNLPELQGRLRSTVMIRREKAQVLTELPEKRRVTVPMELDPAAAREYRRAAADLLTWLAEQGASWGELARAERAEALVRIERLKQLAVRGKLEAVIEWARDMLEAGEKLVVFAHHRETIDTLMGRLSAYGPVRIAGEDSAPVRQAAVDRFQSDALCRVVVASIRAANIGLTLTAASNVAFAELGWTPGEHQQAEDRCHRIGQRSSVTAWYLLAAGTVEEEIASLIDRKAHVLGAVLGDGADEQEGILAALVEGMLRRAPEPQGV